MILVQVLESSAGCWDAETTSSSWGDINSVRKLRAWFFIIADKGPS